MTSKGGEEAAAVGPDSHTYKVTVASHLHPEAGVWTAYHLRASQPTATPLAK